MSEQTKPTAGALRAAEKLCKYQDGEWADGVIPEETAAEIIDRETSVAELLEAAKHADWWFKRFHELGKSDAAAHPTWYRIQQAIAKAEAK